MKACSLPQINYVKYLRCMRPAGGEAAATDPGATHERHSNVCAGCENLCAAGVAMRAFVGVEREAIQWT